MQAQDASSDSSDEIEREIARLESQASADDDPETDEDIGNPTDNPMPLFSTDHSIDIEVDEELPRRPKVGEDLQDEYEK